MDPNTGEVLCLVSAPTYDSSLFDGGISKANWEKLTKDPNKPLVPRAVQASYSPGSTFKIVTSLAAYEKGIFDPNRTSYCDGFFKLGNHEWKCLGHHGAIAYRTALVKSCNHYFADLGYRAGDAALRKASEEMGLGQSTGLDFGSEDVGVVPTDRYLSRAGKTWHPGDTVNMSIGQGYVTATSLQMCDVAAIVANQGFCFKPHLVRAVRTSPASEDTHAIAPLILHKVQASSFFWGTVRDAMKGVIEEGTARSAQIPNVVWAGKTGSTEHGKGKKTHSWFIGFAPLDHPKIAVCVVVEDGGHGGTAAAPIAKDVVAAYLKELEAAKVPAKTRSSASISSAAERFKSRP